MLLCLIASFSFAAPDPQSAVEPVAAVDESGCGALRLAPSAATYAARTCRGRPDRRAAAGFDRGASLQRGTHHRSEEHTSELQSLRHLVCRLLLEKKKK